MFRINFFLLQNKPDFQINKRDIPSIEEVIARIRYSGGAKVERIETSKSDLNELFAYNPLKLKAINDGPNDNIPVYRCGLYIDISHTPLIRRNKKLNSFKILKVHFL